MSTASNSKAKTHDNNGRNTEAGHFSGKQRWVGRILYATIIY
jgi:hypothetical protein